MRNKLKLFLIFIVSSFLFLLIENSNYLQNLTEKADRVNSNKGIGVLIFLYTGKYFLLLLAIISFVFLVFQFLNKKE